MSAGALVTTTALALPASAASTASHHTLFVRQIAFWKDLHHKYQANGKGAWHTETLTQPDDISTLDGRLYVGFQNVPAPRARQVLTAIWTARSSSSPCTARKSGSGTCPATPTASPGDPRAGKVIVTVNEDNLSTGALTQVALSGASLQPKGQTFVRF